MVESLLDICARYIIYYEIKYNDERIPEECIASLNKMKYVILREDRINKAPPISERDEKRDTTVMLKNACIYGDIKKFNYVYQILKFIPDKYISIASYYGNLNIIKKMVIYGSKIHYHNIVEACEHGFLHIVMFLMEHKNDNIDINEDTYFNPLIAAARNGHWEIVKFLVRKTDAKVNIDDSRTLTYAAKAGNWKIVEFLIDHGADRDNALYWAKHYSNKSTIEKLKKLKM